MNIENRNLFRLLRTGAFAAPVEPLEAMSRYKWQRLFAMAVHHNVSNVALRAIKDNATHPTFNFPADLIDQWSQTAQKQAEHEVDERYIDDDEDIRLTNIILNHRLKKILEEEDNSIDRSVETIYLLRLYISLTQAILGQGLRLSQLVRLGIYLREQGDKVDYVKFEQWIDRLDMRKMVDMESSMLILFFHFQTDEFPFLRQEDDSAARVALIDITSTAPRQMHFSEGSAGLVVNTSKRAAMWHITNSCRIMRYYPMEATSNLFHNFFSSLSEIEE